MSLTLTLSFWKAPAPEYTADVTRESVAMRALAAYLRAEGYTVTGSVNGTCSDGTVGIDL